MSTIEEIENLHIEHRLQGLSESFVFKPATYATYGAARKAMSVLMSGLELSELSETQKQIAARWSLIPSEELDSIMNADEQARILAFHKSQIKTIHSNSSEETSSEHYSKVSKEIIYDGTINSTILSVDVIARANSLGDSFSIRLYDLYNSKVVAEKTGLSNSQIEIIDLGDILYQPENKTILELQIKRDSGSDVIISESFEIKFI